jgi:hypothetical protein
MPNRHWILIFCLTVGILTGCTADPTTTAPPAPNTETQATAVSQAPAATKATDTTATMAPATEMPVETATDVPAPEATDVPSAPTEAPVEPDPSVQEPTLSPNEAIRAAMRAQLTGGPYHVDTINSSPEGDVTISGDVVPPDQMHSTLTTAGTTVEILVYGGQMWMNHGEGWGEPMSGEAVQSTLMQLLQDPDSLNMTFSNETFAGVDTVNGSPTWVYTYMQSVDFGMGDPIVSDSRLWIEIATGLPVKLEGTATAMGIPSTTTQIITYDSSITITPPQ